MGSKQFTIPGVVLTGIVLLILLYAGFFDQVSKSVKDVKEITERTVPVIVDTVEDTLPKLIDAGITYCAIPDLVLDAIQPFMLENVNDETKNVLLKIKDGKKITSCEIKILDENLTPIYKSNLNYKSINPKTFGCNLLDCIEKLI
ncbi:MAG: hypothetical protein IIC67_03175 [Thaumarchaeota archaeon]|nr:hypothetical protein [Nitrososphaerota archaeon]